MDLEICYKWRGRCAYSWANKNGAFSHWYKGHKVGKQCNISPIHFTTKYSHSSKTIPPLIQVGYIANSTDAYFHFVQVT